MSQLTALLRSLQNALTMDFQSIVNVVWIFPKSKMSVLIQEVAHVNT